MKYLKLILFFLTAPLFVFSQTKAFEIFGTITGEHKDSVFLFYEGNMAQKDSLRTPIKDGRFYFRLHADLPVLCRLHLGGNSNINELYIDGARTYIGLKSALEFKDTPDSMGGAYANFSVVSVKGSGAEDLKQSFAAWKTKLDQSALGEEQKHSEHFSKLQAFISEHPKSKISAYLIAGGFYMLGQAFMLNQKFPFSYPETLHLASLLDSSLHQSREWENLSRLLNKLNDDRNRALGIAFYDAQLRDTTGAHRAIKEFRNKYVLVDFWASWCKPCRAMNPELKALYGQYKAKGFEIVGVSMDTEKATWKKAIAKDELPWVQLIDEQGFKGELAKHYGLERVPLKVLLDREGKVIGFDLSTVEIETLLSRSL